MQLRASVLYGSVVVLASGLAPNQKRSPSSMERREVLPFAIGAVLAPVVADAEDMVAPFTTPLPAQENRGVFKCFGEVDGKMVNTIRLGGGLGETKGLGKMLFTKYLLPFEIVSVLLLVAMVGCILLSKRDEPEEAKSE